MASSFRLLGGWTSRATNNPSIYQRPQHQALRYKITRVKIVLLVMFSILLNLFHVWMVPCTGILFESTIGMKHTTPLSKETKCSVDMETIQGMRKHRKVTLRAEETHDLQVVAWRLQERKWMDSASGGCPLSVLWVMQIRSFENYFEQVFDASFIPLCWFCFWMFVYFLISRQDLLYILVFGIKNNLHQY